MIQEWTTYTVKKGSGMTGRVQYHSEWSKSKPWAAYVNGTATQSFATLEEAREYFKSFHYLELNDQPE